AEDRTGEKAVLQRVVALSGGSKAHMVVLTTASSLGVEIEKVYEKAFLECGAARVTTLHIQDRADANDPENVAVIYEATGVFMTGGDQTRLASVLGGSEVGKAMHRAYKRQGVTIAGTSAGASAVSEHMIAGGKRGIHPKKGMLNLVPGLGLLNRVIIDQHFSQRQRLGRLLSIVAQNPFLLGIGIDENTAIVVEPDLTFEVIGAGAVTILDARGITNTNVNEAKKGQLLAMCNVQFHLLPEGQRFHIEKREPGPRIYQGALPQALTQMVEAAQEAIQPKTSKRKKA
ncbi:MAG TPA: cyanophycinase, partial [Oscillatoriaceae cyanobacterium]